MAWAKTTVIPAQAGIQWFRSEVPPTAVCHSLLDSRLRGNDGMLCANDGTSAALNPLKSDRPARFGVISASARRLFRYWTNAFPKRGVSRIVRAS
ncbi:MAG: hypothetical protein JWP89_3129 [Schlesneria sp.]|nr:hypothetical protein [Schlesneria sp.]